MIFVLSNGISADLGINSALAAGYIYGLQDKEAVNYCKKKWVKCSAPRLCAVFPHLHKGSAQGALKRLVKAGILVRFPYEKKKFDNTYYYAFTEYGKQMMKRKDMEYGNDIETDDRT